MQSSQEEQRGNRLPLDNEQIARQLDMLADLLTSHADNPFRARAYRLAAQTVRNLQQPVHRMLEEGGLQGLQRLPGIGPVLARSIEELAYTGRSRFLEQQRGLSNPEQLLTSVPGVGPELAARIHEQLGIETLEDLEQAAYDGRLEQIPGMGSKRLRAIRDSLAGRLRSGPRILEARPRAPAGDVPSVQDLLEVDRRYRQRAEAGTLRSIAPRRFNPQGEAWLPVLRTHRGAHRYTALYSNTAQAHKLGTTRDWVVIYQDDDGRSGQWTVVTAKSGPLRGRRVVRGREVESAEHYARRARRKGS